MPVALSLLLTTAVAAGWWHDGTARYPDARPPTSLSADAPTFRAALPAPGNASPVRLGDLVCGTSEPTTVWCADAATGALQWQATNDRVDTLAPDARAARTAELAEGASLAARRDALKQELAALQREARRAGADAARARQAALTTELADVEARYAPSAPWLTPPDGTMIGYSSPTPLEHDGALYVLTGNGVVSRFGADGTRRWAVWLGEAAAPMRGFEHGSTSSPQWVDGRLLVGHRVLQALDPETGAVAWADAAPWVHYGTPAVADVGGRPVVVTPDGRVLRGRDGAELARGLGDLDFLGPVVDGDVVYAVGGRAEDRHAHAEAWRVVPDGADGVRAEALWNVPLPKTFRVYAQPLVHDGQLVVVTFENELLVLDAADGRTLQRLPLVDDLKAALAGRPDVEGHVIAWGQPTLAGDHVFVAFEKGLVAVVDVGAADARLASIATLGEATRSTPLFEGGTAWVRTLSTLWRFDAPPG